MIGANRGDKVQGNIRSARKNVAELSRVGDSLALSEVNFGVVGYRALAYGKGPLVLQNLLSQLPAGVLDLALRRLVNAGAKGPITLEDFYAAVRGASERSSLQIPWIESAGDVGLRLGNVAISGDQFTAVIEASPIPAGSDFPVAGAPIALEFGGRGWRELRYLALDGPVTEFRERFDGRELRYVRLDPEMAWPAPVENGFFVSGGAQITATQPPRDILADFGGTELRLEFDRPLAPITALELMRGQAGAEPKGASRFDIIGVSLSNDGRTLIVNTEPWRPERRYILGFATLQDSQGLPVMQTPYLLQIAPSTDEEPARIVATVPAVGDEIHAPGGRFEISLTFDEWMKKGQAITGAGVRDVIARGYAYPKLDGFGRWQPDKRTIVWTCVDLEAGKAYALPVRGGSFHDLSGNGCQELDLAFTVGTTSGTVNGTPPPRAPR